MILQLLADGVLSGAIIALGAIGMALAMKILGFANFSHSELVTWGAYLALILVLIGPGGAPIGPFSFGWTVIGSLVLAGILTAALAVSVDALVFRPLRRRGAVPVTIIFASFGAALVLRNGLLLWWGPQAHYYTRELQMAVQVLPGVRIMPDQVFVLGLSLALVAALHLFLTYTRFGIAMRAVAESPTLARVSGIEVERVIRWTWVISGGLAAVGGVFFGLTVQIRPEMGFNLLLPIFAAAILGGLGSLWGSVLGGLIIGLAESLSVLVAAPGYKPAAPFVFLMLILFLRPTGLFGEEQA